MDMDKAQLEARYNDLWYDYEKQKANVYFKPRNAVKSWSKPEKIKLRHGRPMAI